MEPAFPNGGASDEQQAAGTGGGPGGRAGDGPGAGPPDAGRERTRIMRRVLPTHAKISEEAREVIQECVSEFISFITGEANDWCHREHRKTVTADDLVWAMQRLGFDDYVMPLSVYLWRMRESESGGGGDRGSSERVDRAHAAAAVAVAQDHAPNQDAFPYVQMQQAAYAPPDPVQGYAVGVPVLPAPNTVHVGGQQEEVFNGGNPMSVYYRGMPYYGEGNSNGGFVAADEGSSSSFSPAPSGAGYE
ncbi:hypothetical protein GUJ93_ZPchr0006g44497 [Zizania palustris]|uniref:Transcription factor CBF/NF-Y/archaeal histone domain-containing protein n=1 Tax=Zizania palustris TaxID=103762 RepID=A0A8J5T0Z6_ZIZPA|nr:hypothetical protein GUJ93_ZPchr0006g44497 [Zizania palustris]